MLTYENYIKHWPKDYSDNKLIKLYARYVETEMNTITIDDMIKAKDGLVKANASNLQYPVFFSTINVPTCEAPKAKAKFGAKVCDKKQEVENTMTTYNEIEASRKYLNNRVQSVFWTKRNAIATQFRIHNSDTPRTYKELIDAIKNDKFTLDAKRTAAIDEYVADEDWYGNAFDGIKFNLPTAPDRDGYKAAADALEKAKTATYDVIATADPAAGLKALQDFEAWTFTAPTTTTVQ